MTKYLIVILLSIYRCVGVREYIFESVFSRVDPLIEISLDDLISFYYAA